MDVELKYTCGLCGLHRVACKAVPRGEDQGVTDWVENVAIAAIIADHKRRSPDCHPRKLDEIMIPVSGVDRVGDVPKQ